MLKIRLQRTGRKHEPTFRVVLTESQNGPKSGKFLEILGSYDARDKNEAQFKSDRIKYWISNGAQVSDTMHNLLISNKIIEGKKINVLPKKSPIIKEEASKDNNDLKEEVEENEVSDTLQGEIPVQETVKEEKVEEESVTKEVKEEEDKKE